MVDKYLPKLEHFKIVFNTTTAIVCFVVLLLEAGARVRAR